MNNHSLHLGSGFRIPLVFLLFAALTTVCSAQQGVNPAPAPKAPLVSDFPNPSSWTVEISNFGDRYRERKVEEILAENPDADAQFVEDEIEQAHPDPAVVDNDIRTIHGTYANGVRHEALVHRNGKNRERYLVAHYFVFDHPREDRAVAIPAIDWEWTEQPIEANQPSEFGWVRPQYHIGRTNHQGRACDVYEVGGWRALIDAETKLPVLLKDGSSVRRYRFDPVPEGTSVALPERFAQLIKQKLLPVQSYLKKYDVPER